MEHILDLGSYKYLLKKEENLNLQNKSLLLDNKSELSAFAQEFGPQNAINNENFEESIKKIYSELLALENQWGPHRVNY